ncbi:major facilitator superfamily domain-containing protein [Lentinula edodes]|nr:major facilitator superfamily domain-containing protein [Lentinula edodes]
MELSLHNLQTNAQGTFHSLALLSPVRKISLLVVLCLALLLDTFNNSSLYAAIPPLSLQLDISNAQSVWILSGYQLTFASLLLVSGRVSDLYNAKWVFVVGASIMGICALVAGFLRSKIPFLVMRALMGSGAALTIPSALHIVVYTFPDPSEQAQAVAAFGGMGAIGIILGLIVGALLVTYTSWPWVLWFSAIFSGIITVLIMILVPNVHQNDDEGISQTSRIKKLDLAGVTMFATSLILLIFSVTTGSSTGWNKPEVLVPLICSFMFGISFFIWEAKIPESYAAVPPKMWHYTNFTILVAIALQPIMWWVIVFLVFSWLWENVYGWSGIITGVHFLPVGLGMFIALPFTTMNVQKMIGLKWVIFSGQILMFVGTTVLIFANSKVRYWQYFLPGSLLGTMGAALIYATTNIALLAATPPAASGIVSAIFNVALQTGSAIGLAITTSIQTSIEESSIHGGPDGFEGRAAGLAFLATFIGIMTILFLFFAKCQVMTVNGTDETVLNHISVEEQKEA